MARNPIDDLLRQQQADAQRRLDQQRQRDEQARQSREQQRQREEQSRSLQERQEAARRESYKQQQETARRSRESLRELAESGRRGQEGLQKLAEGKIAFLKQRVETDGIFSQLGLPPARGNEPPHFDGEGRDPADRATNGLLNRVTRAIFVLTILGFAFYVIARLSQ